ncbi:MAG: Serine/threonine-protein kinase PknD [Myxococcota bacterium]|nr:Serine/threonine-protein kinase PknD [Myxococcota bacterium]
MDIANQLRPGQFSFNVIREIGRGGLGVVNEIEVVASNQCYPIGTHLAQKKLNSQWRNHPEAVERFEREINAVRQMSHPNIIPYKGENLSNGSERFYCMPLYPTSLRHHLFQHPSGFHWSQISQFGLILAKALSYAHNLGFIHRDLKPENILLDQRGNPVIADWGLGYFVHKASKVLAPLTRGGMGTEYYCSLEQWNTGKCDQTGDIYSLGILLAELATGVQNQLKYVGGGIQENIVNHTSFRASKFNTLIQKMTQLLPERRLQTMREVSLAISALK